MDKKLLKTIQEDSSKAAEESKKKSATATAQEVKVETPIVEEKKVEEPKEEIKTPVIEAKQETDRVAELLKELNISSIDELKAKVNPAPAKTEDEDQAELIAYVTQKKLGSPNDFFELNKVKSTPPKQLVRDEFAAELKKKDPKITEEKIQAKFDRKFADKVKTDELDADGNEIFKVVYDEEDINDAASKIIEGKSKKIEDFKKSFSDFQDESKFYGNIQKEAENIKNTIPKSIKLAIGEELLDYDIDDKIRPEIEKDVATAYQNARAYQKYLKSQGVKIDENFDINAAIEFAVWNKQRQNIMQIYGSKKIEQGKQEALKAFNNPHTETLETKEVSNKKVIPSDAEQMRNIARQVPNFGRRS